MKKIILLPVLIVAVKCSTAQQPTTILLQKIKDSLPERSTPPIDNMPNAFAGKKYSEKFIRNNGQGFDIYENSLDNMPVLKPDSTFKSNMASSSSLKNVRKFNLRNVPHANEMIKPYNPLKPKKKISPLFKLPQADLQTVPLVP